MNTYLVALLLAIWSGTAMVLDLSGLGVRTALISGTIAGILVGDVALGFTIGATCLLMSVGFYTYGGATIPDYVTGAMFGTVVAKATGSYDVGLATAATLSLLMTQFDILGRASTTVFQHLADKALAKNSIRKFEMWTLAGTLPWFFSRFIPTFIGVILMDSLADIAAVATSIEGISNGLSVVGRALPAVGFALLLSYMDIKKYWPFLVAGYVMYAFMDVGTIGLALVGAAAGALYISNKRDEVQV
ncbi:MAG: PTS sugar transporter subunit IIC [Erysipelotrichaceae bacterium]|nr:PTS sugar transporter subunit IIC [Erysipelotrichaceae bacterium]MBR3694293.1 PTS sugar transporter subunit IIC [Erysipelotrichales bacterium]